MKRGRRVSSPNQVAAVNAGARAGRVIDVEMAGRNRLLRLTDVPSMAFAISKR